MKVRDALRLARDRLQTSGVQDPGFEAEYLIRHALLCTRETLLINLDTDIAASDQRHFDRLIGRRVAGEPSAYITRHREFNDLEFKVDSRALIPRPETEHLVELACAFATRQEWEGKGLTIVDVGTGCGAIAIALSVYMTAATIFATDLSADALALAGENVARHGVQDRVILLQGDLLAPIPSPIDILVSNPPYISSSEISNLAREITGHEPLLALDGGPCGMTVIERLLKQAKSKLSPGGAMFVEIGWDQGQRALACSRDLWPDSEAVITSDLAGLDRVLTIKPPIPAAQPV